MKKRIFTGALSFNAASLRMGASGINLPPPTDYETYLQSFDKPAKDYLQMGLFGNDANFYGNVTANDAIPKPEDYIKVPFRLLSATIVGAGTWKATDFSNAQLLMASKHLLEGKGVYKDHETDVNNWVGIVEAVKWSEGYVTDDGIKVPAGIDGILAIDTKVDIKLARGIMAGAIYSNSVTVEFEWAMSHDMTDDEFFRNIGKFGADGKMIRRIVTKITNFHETSLVWLGADPFAKAIDPNGGLKHIDISGVVNFAKAKLGEDLTEFDQEPEERKKFYTNSKNFEINCGIDENVLSLAKNISKQQNNSENNNEKPMDKKVMAAFLLTFGKQLGITKGLEELTAEEVITEMGKLTYQSDEDKSKVQNFDLFQSKAVEFLKAGNPEVQSVDVANFLGEHTFIKSTEMDNLTANANLGRDFKDVFGVTEGSYTKEQLSDLKLNAENGIKSLNADREEAIRLYKIAVGEENVDEKVLETYKKADSEVVKGLLKQYTKGATGKFSASCKSCGSTDVSFQSSAVTEDEEPTPAGVAEVSVVGAMDFYKEHAKSSMFGNTQ